VRAWIADIDVDGQEHAVAVVGGDRERLGQALPQPAVHDLGHLVGPHLLRGHPVQGFGRGQYPRSPICREPITAYAPGLDQPTHGLAVTPQRAELDVTGVGMRVEVDHRHPAGADARSRQPLASG
jgi:hypothetical protein